MAACTRALGGRRATGGPTCCTRRARQKHTFAALRMSRSQSRLPVTGPVRMRTPDLPRRITRRYDERVDADPYGAPFVMASPKADRAFDVVVVGSGASGGWAAKRLAEAGLRVAVLEAGRSLTDADYREHVPAF